MKWVLLCVTLIASMPVWPQQTEKPVFDPLTAFAPFDYAHPVNRYRSANGLPGPEYWQNEVDYRIDAVLDAEHKTLSASEIITYTNHSPDRLYFLWLQLDQNRYRADARANFISDDVAKGHTDGYRIQSVEVQAGDGFKPAQYVVSDTRMRVALAAALPAEGGQVQLRIVYSFEVPGEFGGRTGWFSSQYGDVFEMGQWYPRLAVYDDLTGWNVAPYLANEFYLEFGEFNYSVTVPKGMIVAGSGALVNADEVLSAMQRERLDTARNSDATVMIRTAAEVKAAARNDAEQGTRTWRFHMEHTRDVAFAASRAYVWDAARIQLPSGRVALAMSLYPPESAAEGDWERSTEYLKASVEYFSRQWFEYPWPVAIAEAGKVGGMEYPGLVFDWWKGEGKHFYAVTAHEIGHTWFPMIVGSNERRHAWMDEGFNTFIDVYVDEVFNHGEFAPKRDNEYAPGGGNPVEEIQALLADADAPPILTAADLISADDRHPVSYFKAALGLVLLREQILGRERFDSAFRRFIDAWAFKHPSSSDFFRAMESLGGENLAWFWRGWFRNNWQVDMAVTGLVQADEQPEAGSRVEIASFARLPMPVDIEVEYIDGGTRRVHIPVEAWMQGARRMVTLPGGPTIEKIMLDPDHAIPDADRSNNVWPSSQSDRSTSNAK